MLSEKLLFKADIHWMKPLRTLKTDPFLFFFFFFVSIRFLNIFFYRLKKDLCMEWQNLFVDLNLFRKLMVWLI